MWYSRQMSAQQPEAAGSRSAWLKHCHSMLHLDGVDQMQWTVAGCTRHCPHHVNMECSAEGWAANESGIVLHQVQAWHQVRMPWQSWAEPTQVCIATVCWFPAPL